MEREGLVLVGWGLGDLGGVVERVGLGLARSFWVESVWPVYFITLLKFVIDKLFNKTIDCCKNRNYLS